MRERVGCASVSVSSGSTTTALIGIMPLTLLVSYMLSSTIVGTPAAAGASGSKIESANRALLSLLSDTRE